MVRPFVLLSVAASIDGYTDDTNPDRLLLSNAEDFDRVDQVRAESDAILIGAETIRVDNPRLIVKSTERRAERTAHGKPEYPIKITVTRTGNLAPESRFWHHGGEKVVYTVDTAQALLKERLDGLAEIVSLGSRVDFSALLDDLGRRGVQQLVVEGGGSIHTAFLSAGLVDEIHLAIAPLVVGDRDAPRFLHPTQYVQSSTSRMHLAEARVIGDVVLLRYLPKLLSGDS